ncbi:MAG: AI-2E family transporter [Anaerolineales bacterium]
MPEAPSPSSPTWGPTTKLVVALTLVAIAAWLLIQFHGIIAPLLMAFVLAYLLHPVAGFLQRGLRLAWPIAVSIIYLILLLVLIGMLTLGGLGLVQQIESLVALVQANLSTLPSLIQGLSGQIYQFGPFQLDLQHLDMAQLSSQLLGVIQPLLGGTGNLVASLASGAAQFLGWSLFVLAISYFVLAESGGLRGRMLRLDIPGYSEDARRMGLELSRIWNAFLRGQIVLFLLTAAAYLVVLNVLGVRYSLGIAMLAGLARFLPYVGPFITWTTLAMVTYFQARNMFGLGHLSYTIIALATAILIDQIMDNLVSPRIIAQAVRVHPAGVLVAAIVAANVLGLLGVVVAAPMLATVVLMWNYTVRKMLDLDPWPEPEPRQPRRGQRPLARLKRFWRKQRKRFMHRTRSTAAGLKSTDGGGTDD